MERLELDVGNEAIAATLHGLDKARGVGGVAQYLAQFAHRMCGHRVADGYVRPDGVE